MNAFAKLLATLFLGFALLFGQARPAVAGIDTAAIVAAISAAQAALAGIMTNLLNLNLMKTSAQATFQSEKLIATISETAKAQQSIAAQRDLQRDAAKIKEDMKLPPMACQNLASADTWQKADDGARDYQEGFDKQIVDGINNTVNTAAETNKLNELVKTLEKAGVKVNATTLTRPSTYSPDELKAAEAYVKQLVGPPPEALPKGTNMNTPQAKAWEAEHSRYKAQISLATTSLGTIIASRAPQTGAGASAGLADKNASQNAIMQAEIDKRSKSADYKKTVMTAYASPLPVLKEIALTMGTGLAIDKKTLETLERLEVLTAAQYIASAAKSEEALRRSRDAVIRSNASRG